MPRTEENVQISRTFDFYENEKLDDMYLMYYRYELIYSEEFSYQSNIIHYTILTKNSNIFKLMNSLKNTFKKEKEKELTFSDFEYEKFNSGIYISFITF